MRVLTLTMNPCVDRTLWLDGWESQTVREDRQSGGKGINVARVLSALGDECIALAPLGGDAGAECLRLARCEGVDLRPVPISGGTRTVVTRVLTGSLEQRVAFEKGPRLTEKERADVWDAATGLFAECGLFCACGSAADEGAAELIRDLLREAKKRGVETLLDASGDALRLGMEAAPGVVAPNERELCQLLGREIGADEVFAATEEVAGGGVAALVKLGARGAIYARDGHLYCAPAPKVEAVNPVGSGDSFLAGFLHATMRGDEPLDALRFACLCGAANAGMFPAARITIKDLDMLKKADV